MPAAQDAVDPERLAAFLQQLGIADHEDADFGWIAEVGLQSPLPPRWTSHTDDSTGYVYYVDHDSQTSSWENPLVPFLRRVVEIGRAYLQQPRGQQEDFFEDQKGLLWHQHKHDLDCWNGPFTDAEGRLYYVNATAGLSSWQDPRIDAQYIFELESGLLSSLQEVLPPPQSDLPAFGGEASATEWHTADGTDVLTLDGGPPPTAGGRRQGRPTHKVLAMAHKTAKEETKSTLETMGAAVDRLHDSVLDEDEAQRLQLARKVEARRLRLQRAKAKANAAAAGAAAAEQALAACPAVRPPPLTLSTDDASDCQEGGGGGGDDAGANALGVTALPGLPPPPPPTASGAAAFVGAEEATPPRPPPASGGGGGGDDLGPPSLPPSPMAGKRPSICQKLEQRLASMERRWETKAKAPAMQEDLTKLELKA